MFKSDAPKPISFEDTSKTEQSDQRTVFSDLIGNRCVYDDLGETRENWLRAREKVEKRRKEREMEEEEINRKMKDLGF